MIGIGQLILRLPPDADWFTRHFAQDWTDHYLALSRGERSPDWADCVSSNVSVARVALLEAGGVATDLKRGCNVELAFRLKRSGYAFAYLPDALGYQDERKELRGVGRRLGVGRRGERGAVSTPPRHIAKLARYFPRSQARLRRRISCRLLLALGVAPATLERIARLLGQRGRTDAWYRALRGYCFWRGVRRALPDDDTWRRLTEEFPILTYHAFGEDGELPKRFVVPAGRFRRQMACLRWMGFHVLSLDEYVCCLRSIACRRAGRLLSLPSTTDTWTPGLLLALSCVDTDDTATVFLGERDYIWTGRSTGTSREN